MNIRIAITGTPRAGKSTLASQLGRLLGVRVLACDDAIEGRTWSEQSEEVATWFDRPGSWVIEGCTVARALRKYREHHTLAAPPVDRLVILTEPRVELSEGQRRMAASVQTVIDEIAYWLNGCIVYDEIC